MHIEKEIWLWGPQFPSHLELALKELSLHKHSVQHIAVDGGVLIKPNLSEESQSHLIAIGDGDSGPIELMDQVHPTDKDRSDLSLALDFIANQYSMPVHLRAFGFCGGRLDHHMISQGCFSRFLKSKPQSQIRLDNQWLMLAPGSWSGHLTASTVSLLTFDDTEISLQGDWRWRLDQEQMQVLDDRLLSNQVGAGDLKLITTQPLGLYCESPINTWWKHD